MVPASIRSEGEQTLLITLYKSRLLTVQYVCHYVMKIM